MDAPTTHSRTLVMRNIFKYSVPNSLLGQCTTADCFKFSRQGKLFVFFSSLFRFLLDEVTSAFGVIRECTDFGGCRYSVRVH